MEQPQSRFHGKVRVQRGETSIEINVFDDNREKVYLEVAQAIAQFSGAVKPAEAAQSKPPMAEPARAAAAPSPAPKPTATGTKAANAPVCEECNSFDMVELIAWVDKKTGERKKAWKCQRCKKWVSPNQKQPARELEF
jgi:hypothetical protein